MNFVLPAIAPETIVVAVEQKTVANIRNTLLGRSPAAANFPAANRLGVPINPPMESPYKKLKPITQKRTEPMQ